MQGKYQQSWPKSAGGSRAGSGRGGSSSGQQVHRWEVYYYNSSFQRANTRWHIWEHEQETEREARDEAAEAAAAGTARWGSPNGGGSQQQPGSARGGSRAGSGRKASRGVNLVGLGYWALKLCVFSLVYLVSFFLLFASITLMRPMALVVALALMLSRY